MKKFLFLIVLLICLSGCGRDKKVTADVVKCLEWYDCGLQNMDNPEREFTNAIKACPDFVPPYYWLGYHYCRAKRGKDSIKYFEQYLQASDANDPQEVSRRKTAKQFIREIKAGNMDYDSIVEKSLGGE